jgi:adenylate cyclase
MHPSDEIKNAVLHLYASMTSGDVSAIERLFSRQSGVLAIGSDPNEWWTDYDTINQVFSAQFQGGSGKPIIAKDLHAFAEGTVGWASERRTSRLPNGNEIAIRETLVFHQEEGEWKIVQLHVSLGIPNEDVFE